MKSRPTQRMNDESFHLDWIPLAAGIFVGFALFGMIIAGMGAWHYLRTPLVIRMLEDKEENAFTFADKLNMAEAEMSLTIEGKECESLTQEDHTLLETEACYLKERGWYEKDNDVRQHYMCWIVLNKLVSPKETDISILRSHTKNPCPTPIPLSDYNPQVDRDDQYRNKQ